MRWCCVLSIVCLVANAAVNGGQPSFRKEVPADLTINKFQKTETGDSGLEFTKGATDITSVDVYNLLVIVNDVEQYNVYNNTDAIGFDNTYTVTFNDNFDSLAGKKVDFVLNAIASSSVVTGGTTSFDNFPASATNVVIELAKYDDGTLPEIETKVDKYILRVHATDFGDLYEIIPTPEGVKTKPNTQTFYYLQFDNVETSYSLCNSDNDAAVCDKAVDVTAGTLANDLTLESATLRYSNSASEEEIEVVLTSGGSDTSLDAIIIKDISAAALCTSVGLIATCDSSTFTLGDDASMFIIGLDATGMTSYADFVITDYHVSGQALTSSTLEVRWDFQESLTQYKITRTPTDGAFNEAIVNCDPGDPGVPCFGYFTGLTASTEYTISVRPNKGDASDNLNIIEAEPIQTETKFSGLQISLYQLSRRKYDGILDAQVCFNHITHNKETDFSHYEFTLINNQGQWLKQKLITQNEEGDLCFTPFTIQTHTFDVTGGATLVVSQRATDGFAVLASGETRITFS